jgi:pimeloyl-ACP methyl ester carboxylesterase
VRVCLPHASPGEVEGPRRAELLRFPAGHAAHLETPEAFGDALERFLDGLAGQSGGGTSSTA